MVTKKANFRCCGDEKPGSGTVGRGCHPIVDVMRPWMPPPFEQAKETAVKETIVQVEGKADRYAMSEDELADLAPFKVGPCPSVSLHVLPCPGMPLHVLACSFRPE